MREVRLERKVIIDAAMAVHYWALRRRAYGGRRRKGKSSRERNRGPRFARRATFIVTPALLDVSSVMGIYQDPLMYWSGSGCIDG